MAWDAGDRKRDDWETPPDLFAQLDAEFHFTLDPCATDETAKCPLYFTPEEDGLSRGWFPHTVFMNPPYGRPIGDWMRKARAEADAGCTVVCLVPARLDARWWNETTHRSELRFRAGRLNFVGGPAAFPGPVAVVVMRPTDPKLPPPEPGQWRTVQTPLSSATRGEA